MSNTAAHMVDNVLPALPYRQWVLSVPRRVRFLLATDHDLLSRVLDMALRKVFAWQKRAARRLGIADPMCGAIGFVQGAVCPVRGWSHAVRTENPGAGMTRESRPNVAYA